MAILNNSNAISAGGYDVNNSLRFRSSASAYLSRTPTLAGNQKTWTWSGWVKRGALSASTGAGQHFGLTVTSSATNNPRTEFNFQTDDTIRIGFNPTGTTWYESLTTAVFRDPSAWYHIVVAVDMTQATSGNRLKLYVNGVQQTLGTYSVPAQNTDVTINSANVHNIGRYAAGSDSYFDGYMTDINFIDGQALTPSSFGETDSTTGVWKPKAYTGTYGTNGFYLKFSDIATTSGSNAGLGKDFSGNGNYWTTNNISVTSGTTYDAMLDVPTNTSATVGNYCVLNPLDIIPSRTLPVISGGNLDASNGGSGDDLAHGTIAVSSGKWYFEMVAGTVPASNTHFVGWQVPVPSPINGGLYRSSGTIYDFSGTTTSAPTYTANDIIGCIIDVDAGKVWFSKNGTYVNSGNPAAGTNPAYTFTAGSLVTPALSFDNIASTCTASVNFGQRPFAYTPPSGYVALNTYNLPTPTILQGNKYMDATLYTGTGATQSITNAGSFKPDLVWLKTRSSISSNLLYDSTRGVNVYLSSNQTAAEATLASSMTAFNSNGFSLGTDNNVNQSTVTFVGWQWQAGQGTTSSNTSGSITSTVSVNATAGFSIVTYTGVGSSPKTVGHGLGVAPKMILLKSRGAAVNWYVWHTSLGATQVIEGLNTTGAASSQITFNNTLPTSSVISLGNNDSNLSGANYVLYVWAEIAGFSKFGSYTGNGSSDGPFVYTGFRPKFIMLKSTTTAGSNWWIYDTSRSTYNAADSLLFPNLTNAEYSGGVELDILSNGFKFRNFSNDGNKSGDTFIYAAFAEFPFSSNCRAR